MRRLVAIVWALSLLAGACGGSGGDRTEPSSDTSDSGETTSAAVATTIESATTEPIQGVVSTTMVTPATEPEVSAAVGVLAVVTDVDGNFEIYGVGVDGSDPTNLTNSPAWDRAPAWSPDGSGIAFESDRNGNVDVYVLDVRSGDVTRLTDDPAWDGFPTWSPEGSDIAFESDRNGNPDIYAMAADGSSLRRLTSDPGLDFYPAWSPDGSQIAFTNRDDSGNGEVYVMGADGSSPVNLTGHDAFDQLPAWSPDGSLIAFTSDRDGNDEVYVMGADGSDPVNLTNHPAPDGSPAWSPDGSLIAFTSERDGNAEIYVMAADGSDPTRVTDSPSSEDAPDWRPAIMIEVGAPPSDTLALGTLQVGFVPFGDGAVLPAVPFDLWLSITGEDITVEVPFEDPEPGTAFGDGIISLTIRTFAVPLPPGDYEITAIMIWGSGISPDPVALPVPIGQNPRFRITDDAPCTFIGDVTILGWRLPAGDFATVEDLVLEASQPEGSTATVLVDTGTLVSNAIGLSLMEELMEGDFSGYSWWLGGQEVDAAECAFVPAQF